MVTAFAFIIGLPVAAFIGLCIAVGVADSSSCAWDEDYYNRVCKRNFR